MKQKLFYWFSPILFGTTRFIWHCILSFKNGSKGKVIPPIMNPLLLKSATKLAQEIREGKTVVPFPVNWFSHILFGTTRFIWHCILSFKNGSKGKVVPSIKDPLLLKSATKLTQEIREGQTVVPFPVYWFSHILFGTTRYIWHCILSFKNGSKGKVVPLIKDPLLLKSATKLAEEIREGKTVVPFLVYWFAHISFGTTRFIWHCILSFKNGSKGKVVPSIKDPLLKKSATKLAEEIREGKLKSEVVVQAYIDRILKVDPLINATVDRCFEEALEKAKEVDSLIASGSYSREYLSKEKPLLGVPFSIKLVFMAKGLRCTSGYKAFENHRATRDAAAVALMKNAGAILIASTNVPELLTNVGTINKLHGTTCNPYDTNRTSGGSSGGESALIAAGGSVLGIGNDMLGSVRIPAHFTGIFAHKATRGLIPSQGCFPVEKLDEPLKPSDFGIYEFVSTGPMCRYAEDLVIAIKTLSSTSERTLNFDKKVDFNRITVCYLKEIRTPFSSPVDKDIENALKKAVSYFEGRYNTTAKEVKIPSLFDANRCVLSSLLQITDLKKALLGGETLGFNEKIDLMKAFIGKSVLCLSTVFLFNFLYFPLFYRKVRTPYYQKMTEDWTKEFDKLLDDNTVLLMPTSPIVAPYHSETLLGLPNVCYTSIFNVLGLPATHCPIGFTKQGLPYGLQIVGRANNDPLTIACAVELERAFGGWKSPGEI